MMYDKKTLSMNEIRVFLNSKEIQRKVGIKEENSKLLLMRRGQEGEAVKGGINSDPNLRV